MPFASGSVTRHLCIDSSQIHPRINNKTEVTMEPKMHACRFRYRDRLTRTLSSLASFLCPCGISCSSAVEKEDYAESFSSALLTEGTHGIPERVASDDPGPAT